MASSGSVSASRELTFMGVLTGEWLKLKDQRSFVWVTLAALLVSAGVSALGGSLLRDEWTASPAAGLDLAVTMPSSSIFLAGPLFGLGFCIWLANEFVSGSNNLTTLIVPRRGVLFSARLVLMLVLSLIFGGIVSAIGLGSAALFIGSAHIPSIVGAWGFWPNVLATLLVCFSVVTVFFSAATFIRKSLPAAGVAAILLFVFPNIEAAVLPLNGPAALTYLLALFPGSLMSDVVAISAESALWTFPPAWAAVLLMGWNVMFVSGAAWHFARHE